MHLLLPFNTSAETARKALEDLQMLLYNFFWSDRLEDDSMPPMIVNPPGLEKVAM